MGAPVTKSHSDSKSLFELGKAQLDLGRPDSLRYSVMLSVLDGQYDKTLDNLQEYLNSDFDYPNFKPRIERFIRHAMDLVFAIRAKRNFPGIDSLTRSKQQELKEKYKQHLYELQDTLKRIELVHHDLQTKDVRSTVYVVKALWFAGIGLVILSFLLELGHGLAATSFVVFGDSIDHLLEWLFSFVGM